MELADDTLGTGSASGAVAPGGNPELDAAKQRILELMKLLGAAGSDGGSGGAKYAPWDVGSGHTKWDETVAQLQNAAQIEQQRAQNNLDVENLRTGQQKYGIDQTQVGDFDKLLANLRGPANPYSYLFESHGLTPPRGGEAAPMPLTQGVLDAYKNQGVDIGSLQKQLTGDFKNPFTNNYLGELGSSLQPAQGNPMQGVQNNAQPAAQGNPLLDFVSSHPGFNQFIASHPDFQNFVSSHPMFGGANPMQAQPAATAAPAGSPAPVGSAQNPLVQPQPLGGQGSMGINTPTPPQGAATLAAGAPQGGPAPINTSMLDPFTKAATKGTGIPGAPSAQQIMQSGGEKSSGMEAYKDYVDNIAGGNFEDVMGLAKNLFPSAGAPVAGAFK